ncbi:MAG: MFS transporter [Deltaproteobacteria bacterium]|nr:MFS transporter [Deltaproteobacteria bacterium]
MKETFSSYQRFVVAILAFLQFTIVLDFMILSPLGAILMAELHITPSQFGRVVSAYAFSAGISGILAAGFADRFDRKRLLLFFYTGFLVGTFLCGVASSYAFLLGARIVTGLFGGVVGSVSFAIVADLFPLSLRGRVMGLIQTSLATSQVLGIPVSLFLANRWGWHSPFLMIVGLCAVAGLVIAVKLEPITTHLAAATKAHPLAHLVATATKPRYLAGFVATMLLATGGFMLMPFGSTFAVQNLGIAFDRLPVLYMVTGVSAMFAGPMLGRAADVVGKYRVFTVGTLVAIVTVLYFTRLGPVSLPFLVAVNVLLWAAITARMVGSFALTSALPDLPDRGAFMSISSSLQQLSGGVASWVAGLIVHQATPTSPLENYPTLGVVVAVSMVVTLAVMYRVDRIVHAA